MGYSASSSAINPQIRYAGRLAGDPVNTLPQAEVTLFAGTGSQTGTNGRWGDYSDMTIDPVDDCTFWYTQEYYATTTSFAWRTRIGSFKFPGCGGAPTPTPTPTPPPTPTPTPAAPSGLSATAVSSSQINLAWTDNANNETGFKIESCQGAGCSNFAADRNGRRECHDLQQHWSDSEHELQLSRARHQSRRRLGVFKHRFGNYAGSADSTCGAE